MKREGMEGGGARGGAGWGEGERASACARQRAACRWQTRNGVSGNPARRRQSALPHHHHVTPIAHAQFVE